MMDFLFVLIAVCPAVAMARHEEKEGSVTDLVYKTACWFYGITIVNFIWMYLRGWGSFDFSCLTLQFLVKYMLSSIATIVIATLGKKFLGRSGG